jgi:Ulp1 family protease
MPAYECSFHWILLVIDMPRGIVKIFDLATKSQEEYQKILDILQI